MRPGTQVCPGSGVAFRSDMKTPTRPATNITPALITSVVATWAARGALRGVAAGGVVVAVVAVVAAISP